MIQAIRSYLVFLGRCGRLAFNGDWRYYTWTGVLIVICLLGLNAYCKQFAHGLILTGMSDEVSWGVYIANFTFLVGMAAAAVMMVIPAYIYHNEELHELVILGELLAVASILMCLAFVTVDLGRPDRFWHLIPGIGQLNFPTSMLAWDVVVLNGYLLLNVYICGYLLYCRYLDQTPSKWFYIPFVFIAIVWAVSIHTVTAFLYVGLGGRPFWNSAIIAPRFLAGAFAAGPAFIILALQVVRRVTASPPTGDIARLRAGGVGSERVASRAATLGDLEALTRHLPELAAVPTEVRAKVIAQAVVVEVNTGDVLLRQGETDNEAFFVLKGRVVVKREDSGRFRVTRSLGPGDQFGEISGLARTPRTGTALAEEPAQVLRLPADALRLLMKTPQMDRVIRWRMSERLYITDRPLLTLRSIVQIAMLISVFLVVCEVFTAFYAGDLNAISSKYLFLGLHGHHALVPWIWTSITFNLTALVLLLMPISRSLRWLNLACVLCIIGIWIEKGMGLVIPGFIPTQLGELMEYTPSLNETLVCLGIWAFGLLSYTVFLRMAVPILQGRLSKANDEGTTTGELESRLYEQPLSAK